MKQLLIIISILLSINLYANDTELTTLEKQNLLEWTNEHCNEKHFNYESLSKDRYFNCEYEAKYPGGLKGSVISRGNPWVMAFGTYLVIFIFALVMGVPTYLFVGMREKDILYGNHKDKDNLLKQLKENKQFIINSTISALIIGIIFLSYIALKKSLIEMARDSELTYIKIILPVVSAMTSDDKVMMLAVTNGRVEVVKYLVKDKKYNPNISIKANSYNNYYKTPLDLALKNKSYDIANFLKQYIPMDKPISISTASKSFDIELLKKSIKLGNPTVNEILGAFLVSIKYDDYKAMEYLYKLNPSIINKKIYDVSLLGENFWTGDLPMIVAIDNNNFKAVKFLISNNVEINGNGIIRNTAFRDNINIFNYLLKNGADIKLDDSKWMIENIFMPASKVKRGEVSKMEKLVIEKSWISAEEFKKIKDDVYYGQTSKYQ